MIQEFFCGIGGMHYAMERFLSDFLEIDRRRLSQCIESYDINPHTNATYVLNFQKLVVQKDIRHVSLQEGIWLLSPPCQPFTRTGKKRDVEDERCQGLMHLISHIPVFLPWMLFLENVVGFEASLARKELVERLDACGYTWKEYLLSPLQLGIPNDRPRYYLCAQRPGYQEYLEKVLAQVACPNPIQHVPLQDQTKESVKTVFDYLDPDTQQAILEHRDPEIPEFPRSLYQSRYAFDPTSICHPSNTTSPCFTKAYGKHSVYSGGFLQTRRLQDPIEEWLQRPMEAVTELGLRLFRPSEIQRLQGFHDLVFPETMTEIQKYKMLGNSMSVDAVYQVMKDAWGHRAS
jgi:tRNA (cytosine38-C5)-methyltransferase